MKQIVKHLIFAVLIVVIFCVQSSMGYRLVLFGAKPDILPYVTATVAVFCGYTSGAWLGILAGLLTDVCSPIGLGLAMPVYFCTGVFGGILTGKYLKKGFASAFLFGLSASILQQLGTALLYSGMGIPMILLLKQAFGGVLYSALLSPIAYGIFCGVDRLMPAPEDYRLIPESPVIRGIPWEKRSEHDV